MGLYVKNCSTQTKKKYTLRIKHPDIVLKKTLQKNEATILVGHGTDHTAWASYLALKTILKEKYGPDIHVSVIDKKPSKELLIEKIVRSGVRQVGLVPFMLVAGVHVEEDLTGEEDSWKKAFNEKNILVTVKKKGIGYRPSCRNK